MAKWGKRLLGLAAIGGAAAGLAYYLKSKEAIDMDDFEDEFGDDDFDLDNDLKPVTDREYVPLTPSVKAAKEQAAEEPAEVEDVAEATDTTDTEVEEAVEEAVKTEE